jgi:flagellar hook assembly protein FlgD
LVRSLVNEALVPDIYTEEWDGRDGDGRPMPSGTYFYHLNTAVTEEVKKMTLAR